MSRQRVRWGLGALALVAVVVGLRMFVVAPVRVTGDSMEPTLRGGQVVLVDKLDTDGLSRGDLVVFHSPGDGTSAVKRVIGIPGDRVVIRDAVLSVNDREVQEPYVDPASIDGLYTPTTTVPEGRIFVLGDNRGHSIDSRNHGPVELDEVQGRVVVRLWPLGCLDPQEPCQ
jgi:signal peptidase I